MIVMVVVVSYELEPSGLYRHQRGLGLHRVGYNGRISTYQYRQACLPRQGKSHPDTGRSLQSCIFIVLESVDDDSPADDSSADDGSPAIRTPPNPGLPQRGLDAPAKFAPTLKVRKGNARYQRG